MLHTFQTRMEQIATVIGMISLTAVSISVLVFMLML